MKKALAYVITGVLLGVTATLLPLGLLFAPSKLAGTVSVEALSQLRSQTSEYTSFEENLRFMGLSPFPSSIIYAGLLFVTSLILALGVYALSKRRMMARKRLLPYQA